MPAPTSKDFSYWLRHFGSMKPSDIRKEVKAMGDLLSAKFGADEETPLTGLVALRLLLSLLDKPDGKLFREVVERVEGRLPTTLRTWRDEYVTALKNGDVDPAKILEELGPDLANELFRAAGIDLDRSN